MDNKISPWGSIQLDNCLHSFLYDCRNFLSIKNKMLNQNNYRNLIYKLCKLLRKQRIQYRSLLHSLCYSTNCNLKSIMCIATLYRQRINKTSKVNIYLI